MSMEIKVFLSTQRTQGPARSTEGSDGSCHRANRSQASARIASSHKSRLTRGSDYHVITTVVVPIVCPGWDPGSNAQHGPARDNVVAAVAVHGTCVATGGCDGDNACGV